MATTPLVSVAISARNAERTIRRAIRSLCLQSWTKWELILISDGSTDATAKIASDFNDPRITVIAEPKSGGLALRLNQALALCHGEYFARLDADDIACPDRLERQVSFLQGHPEVDLVGTGAVVFSGDGVAVGLYPVRQTHEQICRNPWSGFYLAHPTWMGKTAWYRKFRYRTDLAKAQDQDLLLRSYQSSMFACIPEALTGYAQDHLPLKKILMSRSCFSRAIAREALKQRNYLHGLLGLLGQLGKASIDILSVMSGMGRLALRHRALPINEDELRAWKRSWSLCNPAETP